MARIYFVLALFALALLIINLVIGWNTGDVSGRASSVWEAAREVRRQEASLIATDTDKEAAREQLRAARRAYLPFQRYKDVHIFVGIGAALVTMLVNAVGITYFIGTSRWSLEVVETFGLDAELARRTAKLKRQSFAWGLISMLTILVLVSFGALSDPMANLQGAAQWVSVHFVSAIVGTMIIAWSFRVQLVNIGGNYDIIETVMKNVAAERERRGALAAASES